MALIPGARLGPYEIVSALGAGGMGEVYRARDTRLDRDVAIKVLPEAFAADAERVARFQREAKTLASLNHPNIGQIYGLEPAGDVHALVMELVAGEDLSQRIARGAISLDEALPIGRQIAEALEAAHEQGIIHRDLKPANIKVTRDGVVKVLDFGLAKLAHPEAPTGHADVTASPTITSPAMMTGVGVILGTAAYMAPEQAKGRAADHRSDIWAFGCVLYEMLTGTRPFDGEDMTEVLGAVVRLEPNWEALSSEVPPPVRTLLQRCLVKDRRKRVADISTALFVLDNTPSLAAIVGTSSIAPMHRRAPGWRVVAPVAAALVTLLLVGAGLWFATRAPEAMPPRLSRLQITPSGTAALTINGADRDLAITPDGSRLIYVGNRRARGGAQTQSGTQLFVRALDTLEPVAVFTGAPRGPFVSPDGQWIGLIDGGVLKKVPITGGPAIPLATTDAPTPLGATWGPDDTIIFATTNGATGLQQVAAAGGPTTVLTRPDHAHGEADHIWPERLPGRRAMLFTITAAAGGLDAAQVVVQDMQTGARTVLVRGGSHAQYVSSGHLVYATAGTLRAIPFDLTRLQTRGTPVPVERNVVTTANGAMDAVVAGDGTLAYVSGDAVAQPTRTLVWVDRKGSETPLLAPPRGYTHPRLSPDGTRIAAFTADQGLDLWLFDLGRTTFTSVTSSPGVDFFPVWTPDSQRLIFSSQRTGAGNLFWQTADGAGAIEQLTDGPNIQRPTAVSPDGRWLIFTETVPTTGEDVMQLALDRTHSVKALVQSSFAERNGIISPDGRWLAYEANDSGRFEIFVVPFPAVNNGRWPVSTAGGTRPLWARSGRELFYVSPTGAIMRVGVERGPSWAATKPTLVVKEGYFTMPPNPGRTYDIASDGQRFLMIKEGGTGETPAPASLIVVQHWVEELKRLVPPK